jgi:hypothetical protein
MIEKLFNGGGGCYTQGLVIVVLLFMRLKQMRSWFVWSVIAVSALSPVFYI